MRPSSSAGVLCGLAGTYLSVGQSAGFLPNMTAGKGFIALAALIFAKWRAWPALGACFLFGLLDAVAIRLQGISLPGIGEVPVQAIQALPYLMTVILLAGVIGTRHPAACLGHALREGALSMASLDGLFEAAKAIQAKAYAPYSRFKVGAAIATADGRDLRRLQRGERRLSQSAPARRPARSRRWSRRGDSRIAQIVVMGDGENLVTPCGGCRQRIREFAGAETPIHVAGPEGIRRSFTLDELLPFSFGPDNLSRPDVNGTRAQPWTTIPTSTETAAFVRARGFDPDRSMRLSCSAPASARSSTKSTIAVSARLRRHPAFPAERRLGPCGQARRRHARRASASCCSRAARITTRPAMPAPCACPSRS